MMSPPATLLIISCVARVRPKVSTEAMAVMDEVFSPKAPAVMMTVSRYSSAFMKFTVILLRRSFGCFMRPMSFSTARMIRRTASRHTSSVMTAERICSRL